MSKIKVKNGKASGAGVRYASSPPPHYYKGRPAKLKGPRRHPLALPASPALTARYVAANHRAQRLMLQRLNAERFAAEAGLYIPK